MNELAIDSDEEEFVEEATAESSNVGLEKQQHSSTLRLAVRVHVAARRCETCETRVRDKAAPAFALRRHRRMLYRERSSGTELTVADFLGEQARTNHE